MEAHRIDVSTDSPSGPPTPAEPRSPVDILGICARIVSALLVLGALARTFVGAELTDEAQYVGQLKMLFDGSTPFGADLFIQQTASFLLLPMAAPLALIFGAQTPWVMVFRIGYILLKIATFVMIGRLLSRSIARPLAFLCACPLLGFVPFSLPSFSYNTVGSLALFLSLALLVQREAAERSLLRWGLSGAFGAAAAVAYPPSALAFGIGAAVAWLLGAFAPRRSFISFVFGAAAIAAPFAGVLAWAGPVRLREMLEFSQAFGAVGASSKLAYLSLQFDIFWRPVFTWIVGAAAVLALLRMVRVPRAVRVCGGFLVLLAAAGWCPHEPTNHTSSVLLAGWLALPSALIFLACAPAPLVRAGLPLWVGSLLAGGLAAWSSSNGLYNAGIGLLPLAVLGIASLVPERRVSSNASRAAATLVIVGTGMLTSIFEYHSFRYLYGDGSLPYLDTWVSSGPYAGIRTSHQRAGYFARLTSTLEQLEPGARSIAFFEETSPHGYLFSSLEPTTRMLFMHSGPYKDKLREILVDFYDDPSNRPDLFAIPILADRPASAHQIAGKLLERGEYRLAASIEDDFGRQVQFYRRG